MRSRRSRRKLGLIRGCANVRSAQRACYEWLGKTLNVITNGTFETPGLPAAPLCGLTGVVHPRRTLLRRRARDLLLARARSKATAITIRSTAGCAFPDTRPHLPWRSAPPASSCPQACSASWRTTRCSIGGWIHFGGVGFSALVATAAAIALTIVGARRGDGRTVLLGTAFTVMAALLALHGLATPGIILPYNGLVGFTGAATLPIGGAVLALSALPSLRRPRNVPAATRPPGRPRRRRSSGSVWRGCSTRSSQTASPSPATRSRIAVPRSQPVVFYSVLLLRALRTFLLTRRQGDLAVVVGIAWLTAAVPPALLLTYQRPRLVARAPLRADRDRPRRHSGRDRPAACRPSPDRSPAISRPRSSSRRRRRSSARACGR